MVSGDPPSSHITSPLLRVIVPGFLALVLLLLGCAPRVDEPPSPRSHPGFDTWQYPGNELLSQWRAEAPYEWIGYYLPSPCHRGRTWEGRRAEIERIGFGIAVIYVGQQTWDGVADPEEPPDEIICSRTLLDAKNGRKDAREAIATATAEGFSPNSVIFLNIERMERLSTPMAEYFTAWQETLLEDGRFVPGTYVHLGNADALFALARQAYDRAGVNFLPPFWIAGGSDFSLEAVPTDAGRPYTEIWQGRLDVDVTWGDHELRIDENVSVSRYPSAPRGASATE